MTRRAEGDATADFLDALPALSRRLPTFLESATLKTLLRTHRPCFRAEGPQRATGHPTKKSRACSSKRRRWCSGQRTRCPFSRQRPCRCDSLGRTRSLTRCCSFYECATRLRSCDIPKSCRKGTQRPTSNTGSRRPQEVRDLGCLGKWHSL